MIVSVYFNLFLGLFLTKQFIFVSIKSKGHLQMMNDENKEGISVFLNVTESI